MEGRAIARPNSGRRPSNPSASTAFNGGPGNCPAKPDRWKRCGIGSSILQWRAGQLPGQTGRGRSVAGAGDRPSMEGRAIARPNDRAPSPRRAPDPPSMEGRAIARPNFGAGRIPAPNPGLQWRAGQLPGQTRALVPALRLPAQPSMEGRAIARPNSGSRSRSAPASATFNGGPGNCPAKLGISTTPAAWGRAFNGGPGNCPAKLDSVTRIASGEMSPSMEGRAIARPNFAVPAGGRPRCSLQWRAGQLPGQTPRLAPGRGHHTDPSMEGRAIARPNVGPRRASHTGRETFNGGPGNCPAKLGPGRPGGPGLLSFNGGPGNCPAKLERLYDPIQARSGPSMEGRAIARPNVYCSWVEPAVNVTLQWRAGQLPGQTAAVRDDDGLQLVPSMEGRAIARPNLASASAT